MSHISTTSGKSRKSRKLWLLYEVSQTRGNFDWLKETSEL